MKGLCETEEDKIKQKVNRLNITLEDLKNMSDEQIKAHYKEKEKQVRNKIELKKNKPKARIYLGLNTNSM